MSLLVSCCVILLTAISNGLSITNITPPIDLTDTGFQAIAPGAMTYYIDPSDPLKQKYLYFGVYAGEPPLVESDIFTQDFTQYNNNNNISNSLPFILVNESRKDSEQLFSNPACTSPRTNDILSCWDPEIENREGTQYSIVCKLFTTMNSTWSDDINIYISPDDANLVDIICFDDSYFIPWIQFPNYDCYASLMDLDGNIIHNKVAMNISGMNYLFTTKGGESFNASKVNKDATESIMFSYFDFIDTYIIGTVYAYYTNINDPQFPIYNYYENQFSLDVPVEDYWGGIHPQSINYTSDCCYILPYETMHQSIDDNSDYSNIYAIFTDIYGAPIIEGTVLISNATLPVITDQVIDLSIVSNEYEHYFMVIFSDGSDVTQTTIMAAVYYLKYNTNANSYNLVNNGYFKLTESSFTQYQYAPVFCYILPQQNDLYLSWIARVSNVQWILYGQSFTIN